MPIDPIFAAPGGAADLPQVARIRWYDATVRSITPETPTARTVRLALQEPMDFLAGQHVVVRLVAPDGYRAQRAYSIANAPEASAEGSHELELTVERLDGGEVSTFLHDVLRVGDALTVRGPIGGFFAWRAQAPALLIGGGSGVVPVMSMLRLGRRLGRRDLARMLVSVRSPSDLYYRDELCGPEVAIAYTRQAPEGEARPVGRLTSHDIDALRPADVAAAEGAAFVCGSSGFADHVGRLLTDAGFPVDRIRVERFGPT